MSIEGKSPLQKRGFLRRYITGGKDLGRLRDSLHPSPRCMFHVRPKSSPLHLARYTSGNDIQLLDRVDIRS